MLSRRVFLLTAFTAASLPVLGYTGLTTKLRNKKIAVLSENDCFDTKLFYSSLPSKCIDTDPGLALQELDRSMRRKEFEFLFGLSRDSNFMLIEQYALANSYQLQYHGSHKYDSHSISHSLSGNQEVIEALSQIVINEDETWSKTISQVPLLSSFDKPSMVNKIIRSGHRRPEGSPGQLASWLFRSRRA